MAARSVASIGQTGPVESIPVLEAKPPGPVLRTVGFFVPRIGQVMADIKPFTRYWSEQNQNALASDGPLLVAIGDSTAIGIGASAPANSYIGLLAQALTERDQQRWQVINLAQSGARARDGLDRQLPILERLTDSQSVDERDRVALSVCCIGSNDIVWSAGTRTIRDQLKALIGRLPTNSLVGTVAGGSARARLVNRAVRQAAAEAGHGLIEPWGEPGPPTSLRLASDRFHPNDLGYRLMTRPFARYLGAPEPELPEQFTSRSTESSDRDQGDG